MSVNDTFHAHSSHYQFLINSRHMDEEIHMSQPIRFKIGTTKSLKKIFYLAREQDVYSLECILCLFKGFSLPECFDAYCVFEYLISHSLKKHRDMYDGYLIYKMNQEALFKAFFTKESFENQKRLNGAKTSIDLCRHGSRLVSQEFKDP